MNWINWKKWPYWLKEGTILGGISLLLLDISLIFIDNQYGAGFGFDLFVLISYLPGSFLEFYASIFHFSDPGLFAETHMFYATVPFWFIIGSIIGFFIGRAESKKKK